MDRLVPCKNHFIILASLYHLIAQAQSPWKINASSNVSSNTISMMQTFKRSMILSSLHGLNKRYILVLHLNKNTFNHYYSCQCSNCFLEKVSWTEALIS